MGGISLDEYCALKGGCPTSAEEAATRFAWVCSSEPTPPAFLRYNCGVELVGYDGGYTSGGYLFDEGSGELVGAYDTSDTLYGPCTASGYYGGVRPDDWCEDEPSCNLCEEAGGLTCRFDCDCSQPTGPDPCFGADSCECYCDRLCRSGGECG